MKRRQFFSRLAKAAVAVVATPTALKFLPARKNLKAAVVTPTKVVPFWFQTTRGSSFVDNAYSEFFRKLQDEMPRYVELTSNPLNLNDWLEANYQIKRAREKNTSPGIFFFSPLRA